MPATSAKHLRMRLPTILCHCTSCCSWNCWLLHRWRGGRDSCKIDVDSQAALQAPPRGQGLEERAPLPVGPDASCALHSAKVQARQALLASHR